jgi:hypothetical protein
MRYEGSNTEYQPTNKHTNQPKKQLQTENFGRRKSTSLGPFSHSRMRNASLGCDTDALYLHCVYLGLCLP